EARPGADLLQVLEGSGCRPSALAAARRDALRKRLAQLGDGYRLELRACPGSGPNAFALPGGVVVLTDELVRLAQSADQLSAVMAHEIGHLRARHALRAALQRGGLTALWGDPRGLLR